MVWKTIGAEASIVRRLLQQNAAHIIKTWLWFIFRYWPDLSRAPFCCLQTRNAYHLDTPMGKTAVLV